jgi:hypothetical protein
VRKAATAAPEFPSAVGIVHAVAFVAVIVVRIVIPILIANIVEMDAATTPSVVRVLAIELITLTIFVHCCHRTCNIDRIILIYPITPRVLATPKSKVTIGVDTLPGKTPLT